MGWSILNAATPHRKCTTKTYTKGFGLMRFQDRIKIQRRRVKKLFWLFAAAAVCALVFAEQAAVLYVVLTLATCGLLIAVAVSNLEGRDAQMKAGAIKTDDTSTSFTDLSRGKRIAA